MAYRSLKRVLGETNLERKCRLLFGVCLLVLISGSFFWVWKTTEQLVYSKDSITGRHLVDMVMLSNHFDHLDTSPRNNEESWTEYIESFRTELQIGSGFKWKIIAPEPIEPIITPFPSKDDREPHTFLPQDDWEREMLITLQQRQDAQLAEEEERNLDALTEEESDSEDSFVDPLPSSEESLVPVFMERPRSQTPGEYHFYQPAYWKDSCTLCHRMPIGAVTAADSLTLSSNPTPFRVVKIIISDKDTKRAIIQTFCILLATAILTVFFAMIMLYVIVRNVIVKPLKHLRDVSDEISRGNTQQRADIHTGDEFEELGASFNRMLRHMLDSQKELLEVNADLDEKVDQLAHANMQLYEMNRLKSDFLANMSHELRTPLNSIIGFSEVLQSIESLDTKQKRYVLNIRKSGRLLLDMINDILDLAKMESGKMEVRLTEFPLGAIVTAQCDLIRSLSAEKNIDLKVDVEKDLPPMYQDQGKIQQILTNLLSNSIKFTPEGGRILVSARRDDQDQLVLSVADTGVGIAEEDHEAIFEKFRQGTVSIGSDNLTREYSGTGLGLSIVKELCILLGGQVYFESELGKGSTFSIQIPWVLADQPPLNSQITSKLESLSTAPLLEAPHSRSTTSDRPAETLSANDPASANNPPSEV